MEKRLDKIIATFEAVAYCGHRLFHINKEGHAPSPGIPDEPITKHLETT